MTTGGAFRGGPTYVRTAAQFSVAADTGPHPGSVVSLAGVPPGAYRMVLTFTNFGYAYDGWLRFSPGVDIHVGGGDNPGPYQHTFSQDITTGGIFGTSIQLFGEATGGDDMTFSNITMTLKLIGGRA